MNSFTKYVASVLFAIPMIASAAVDLVTNGSFEIDSQASGTWNIYNSLTGWTGSPNIELRNNVAGTAYEGGNFIELDTYSNSSLSQLLVGTPGSYQLSFWYSARPGTGATNDLTFTVDGSAPVTVLNGASNAGSDHKWLNYSTIINFDGNGLLTFNASGISDSYGGSLDMVSFTSPIPESEIYVMLLIGLGLLRFAAHRKKKNI
ncbi:MAG: pyruvate-binding protein [Nitrosomonas sp.]|uniref:pyruvate-binding protein n=1 Tax=Nitrosomonas sp. TaxID=42353 RepID=UPI00273173DC|nr:pyruvate-binding protein [Nitrosomonas sp.]MBK6957530.1 pyruvate-binding protein [Nitrosomonas sp.]MDP1550396.1 pyruvate-binding protein [Nitrosomonas sp.]MDP1934726.1 pyruvate-binding protein [Nitrosomonas sp.]